MNISLTILTYNSEKSLEKTLESLHAFSDIVLLDSGSQDQTKQIAERFPSVRFLSNPFLGFGPMHNRATSFAKYDWILSLDSDEQMTDELLQEIQSLSLDPSTVYSIPRKNMYHGKHIRGCGWWPDRVHRLYNRTKTCFSEDLVHESIITHAMKLVALNNPIIHTPFTSSDQFITKMHTYAKLYARQRCGKTQVSPIKPYLHSFFAFVRSYFLKKGFLDGWEGLEISLYNANCTLYKYLLLREKNCLATRRCPEEKAKEESCSLCTHSPSCQEKESGTEKRTG